MARIAGINIPQNKLVQVGLTYIYGIGSSFAQSILREAKISEDIKIHDWTDEQTNIIRKI